ncbi:MAG: alpha-hydroxy-acid oxidizing protein [Synergistaceae bacterium]|jgi:isopentenyl diphosphate isomerase/L-lactate dehydrogenase-like FMN-dependent dehydrogenase|nr:alpha-hydroxy-acid oxidizing protein [Synergistaceae bacterium]
MSEQSSAGVNAGDSARITREYFDSLLVELRTIDSVKASTEMELWGETFATPVMVAALSGLNKTRPGGMVDTARGAAAAGAVMWTGIGSEAELEALIATGAKTVKIIKPYADRDLIFRKLEHAEKSGVIAVGMDTDYVFGGKNKRGFAMEYPVSPKTLDDIRSFVRATKLPFILKGILSEQDARKALEVGAGGIVVSHHGGVLDYAVPPLKILPRIVKVIDKKIPVFVDCGITRGMDAFKALALGATAVSVGRAVIAGLSSGGADGVQEVLEDITGELQWAMSLTGSCDTTHIDPEVIWRR